MNTIIKIGVTLFSLVAISACGENFLDVVPNNQVSDATFWRNENDATMALASCYAGWENFMDITYLDAGSDNGFNMNFVYREIGNFSAIASSRLGQSGHWCDPYQHQWFLYKRIRIMNTFLKKVPGIKMDESVKKEYIAEVRFLRAYDYFKKVMFYGGVPLVTEPINTPGESLLARNTEKEVQGFIIKELTECAEDLPVENAIDAKGHATKGAAYALIARAQLNFGNYPEAQRAAKKVIDMNCYELFDDYTTLFYPDSESSNKEAIMSVQYDKINKPNMLPQINYPGTELGYNSIVGTWKLAEAYQMTNGKFIDEDGSGYNEDDPFKNRDPRMDGTLLYPGKMFNGRYFDPLNRTMIIDGSEINNPDGPLGTNLNRMGLSVSKYCRPDVASSDLRLYDADIMVFRLPEMYLTYAEAALKTGEGKDLAVEYINKIRARVDMPAISELTERIVKYERRVEFAFEGFRYFDLKRWKEGDLITDSAIGMREGSVDATTGEITWTSDEYFVMEERIFNPTKNFLFPIPSSEMDTNPNMVQNPGY